MTSNSLREDRLQAFEGGQDIRDRTFRFACRVVRFCQKVYDAGGVGRVMTPQLVNCSTSVAGMLEEARAAESTRDFISKCCIALKECRESHVRLRVHEATQVGPQDEAAGLRSEAGELVAIISAIVRNSKRNAAIKSRASTKSRALNGERIPNS